MEWISVNNVLPETGPFVLCLTKDGPVEARLTRVIGKDFFKQWRTRDHEIIKANHWKPLPNPPEVE